MASTLVQSYGSLKVRKLTCANTVEFNGLNNDATSLNVVASEQTSSQTLTIPELTAPQTLLHDGSNIDATKLINSVDITKLGVNSATETTTPTNR